MIMNIKHLLPIECNYYIKHLKEWHLENTPDDNNSLSVRKRVFFLDAPSYGNVGDQAIAFAMEKFVSDILPDYQQIEVTEDQLPACMKWLRKTIRRDDLICLTGGGNMGVTYQRYEAVRRLILKNFPDNPIVIFPQTFDYGNDNYSKSELRRAVKVYGAVKKLVVCARDSESYKQMKLHFTNATVIFCPDIVLYLDYRGCFEKTNEVGICLRTDKERVLTDTEHEQLYRKYSNCKVLTTTNNINVPIYRKIRPDVVEKKLSEFGSKKLVVTDRLHGAIFAFITGTPCIAFPNTNGKVERVCKYLSERGNVLFTNNVDAEDFSTQYECGSYQNAFKELRDAICKLTME